MPAGQYVTGTRQVRVAPAISRSRAFNKLPRPRHLRKHEVERDWRKLAHGTTRYWHIDEGVVTPPGSIHSSVVAQSPTLQFARTSLQQPSGMQIALTAAWLLSRLPKHCRSDNLTAAATQSPLHSNSLSRASLFDPQLSFCDLSVQHNCQPTSPTSTICTRH